LKGFTEPALQVVVLADEEARILKHNYLGTEHLLLGLLREERGLAARLLESLGVTVERVRGQVTRIVGSGEGSTSGQLPFTPRAKKVLELALREALSLGHNHIATEHILLSLVRENGGGGARILLDFGADAEKVRNEFIRMPSRPGGHHRSETNGSVSGAGAKGTGIPGLSERQRADEIRLARARLKLEIKSGGVDPAGLFLHPPELIETVKVFDLLLGAPGWGRIRTNEALEQLRISHPRRWAASVDASGLRWRCCCATRSKGRRPASPSPPDRDEYRARPWAPTFGRAISAGLSRATAVRRAARLPPGRGA
jgi:ATP-dependent Clp protease ATP-binding subunit ClpC